jgi:hypothetical protein
MGFPTPVVTEADGTGPIRPALLRCREDRFSGVLHIEGGPGGSLCFADGLVTAAVTSAAPGLESLLLKSGRVAETDWIQAYDTGAASGRLGVELVGRGLVGEFGLQVMCLSAAFDAAFAMAAYGANTCRAESGGSVIPLSPLPLVPGLEPERLISETGRRMRAASEWRRLGVSVRCRPRPVPEPASSPEGLDEGRRDIVLLSNGRRTPRDIAFAVGRGLFVVMGEIAYLVGGGLLDVAAAGSPDDLTPAPPATDGAVNGAGPLPQRRRGASKVTEVLSPPPVGRRPMLQRLRAVRSGPPAGGESGDPARGAE